MASNLTAHVKEPEAHDQSVQAHPDQVPNKAGGFGFKVTPIEQLERFIILGTDGGSYYASEKQMTVENFKHIQSMLPEQGRLVVDTIVKISDEARAPKNSSAVFALAVAAVFGDQDVRSYAYESMSKVCRTSTDMFVFVDAVDQLKGHRWGMGLNRAIARWYTSKQARNVVFQICKYPQRKEQAMAQKWGHRDLLRKVKIGTGRAVKHPRGKAFVTPSDEHGVAFHYATHGKDGFSEEKWETFQGNEHLQYLHAHEEAKAATDGNVIADLIKRYGIVRESIPKELFTKKVWQALIDNGMPMTAMIRNLGAMTSAGVLGPFTPEAKKVAETLVNPEFLQKARIHPMNLLIALKAYQSGHGKSTNKEGEYRVNWSPVEKIVEALDDGFHAAFKHVEPTGKNFLLGIDVSGSMGWGNIVGCGDLKSSEAAAVMAMTIARTEKNYHAFGFTTEFRDLGITRKDSLTTVMRRTSGMSFGGTDCALPMKYAYEKQLDVDVFVVLTDNETWHGGIHPFEALRNYRKRFNKDAKLVVMAFTATDVTISEGHSDPGSLEVVGLDSAAPKLVSDFAAGRI